MFLSSGTLYIILTFPQKYYVRVSGCDCEFQTLNYRRVSGKDMARMMIRENAFALRYTYFLTMPSIAGNLQSPLRDLRISSIAFGNVLM